MYGSGEIKRLLKAHRVNFCLPATNEHIALDLVEVRRRSSRRDTEGYHRSAQPRDCPDHDTAGHQAALRDARLRSCPEATPEAFAARIKAETEQSGNVIRAANLRSR
jgi:hypothetical protein